MTPKERGAICRCGHYKDTHPNELCVADSCSCTGFEEVDLYETEYETELGRALLEWLSAPPGEVSPARTLREWIKAYGGAKRMAGGE